MVKRFISLKVKKPFFWEPVASRILRFPACVRFSGKTFTASVLWRTMQLGVRRLGPHATLPPASCEILKERTFLSAPIYRIFKMEIVLRCAGLLKWDDGASPVTRMLELLSLPLTSWEGRPEHVDVELCLSSPGGCVTLVICFSFQFFLGSQLVKKGTGLGLQRGSCSEQARRRGSSPGLFSVRAHFSTTLDSQCPLPSSRSFKMANVLMFWHWKVSVSYLNISLKRNPLVFLWYKTDKVYQLAWIEFK